MIEKLIENYVNKLSYNDIDLFGRKNNIILTDEEIIYLYKTIKKNWKIILYDNPAEILNEAKQTFNNEKYAKIESLLYEYKEKYKNYL